MAAEFPQLCEAETAVIGRLVGTHVQRLATIAHGDGVCTTHIPGARGGNNTPSPRPVRTERDTAHGRPAQSPQTPLIDRERTPA